MDKVVHTEACDVVLEVVCKMVPFSCRTVMKLDINDVMRVLVRHLNHTDHVVRCIQGKSTEITHFHTKDRRVAYQDTVVCSPLASNQAGRLAAPL